MINAIIPEEKRGGSMLKLLLGRNQDQISEAVLRAAAERVPGRCSLVIVPEQYSHVTERRL